MTAQPDLFDRGLFKRRRIRALQAAKPGAEFLLEEVARDLEDRLRLVNRSFRNAIDLGGHTGLVAAAIGGSGKAESVFRADLFCSDPRLPAPDLVCDDAVLPLGDQSFDLIVSA